MDELDQLQRAASTAYSGAENAIQTITLTDWMVVLGIVVVVLSAVFCWLWLFVSRRPPANNERAPNISVSGFRRYRIWRLGSWTWASIYDHAEPSPVPPIVHYAHHSGRIPKSVSRKLRELIRPSGTDALILRDAVRVPAWWRSDARANLRSNHKVAARWAHGAMKQVMCYMAHAGYLPLVHCYDEAEPQFIFRAKAFEERGDTGARWPHRLFEQPATVMPHLPFGPALFGAKASLDGTVAPDIVAFIMLESRRGPWQRRKLGPHLFFLDQLEDLLKTDTTKLLHSREYKIEPDSTAGDGNVFGHVERVNLIGERSTTGTKYMRFDLGRTAVRADAAKHTDLSRALKALTDAFSKLQHKSPSERLDLRAGDVLIINNWRIATQWDQKCETLIRGNEVPVASGDRLVFQMNFYYPKELKPDDQQSKTSGDGTDKTSTSHAAAADDPEVVPSTVSDALEPIAQ